MSLITCSFLWIYARLIYIKHDPSDQLHSAIRWCCVASTFNSTIFNGEVSSKVSHFMSGIHPTTTVCITICIEHGIVMCDCNLHAAMIHHNITGMCQWSVWLMQALACPVCMQAWRFFGRVFSGTNVAPLHLDVQVFRHCFCCLKMLSIFQSTGQGWLITATLFSNLSHLPLLFKGTMHEPDLGWNILQRLSPDLWPWLYACILPKTACASTILHYMKDT